jgi:N-acetyl-anhydromuramyl-L-alanine amidase AmpD
MLQIAVEVWENYPDLLIKNMIKHPEIQNANKTTPGSPYSEKTLHGFLSEKAPQSVKKHKRPSKETQRRQAEICKELNIPL